MDLIFDFIERPIIYHGRLLFRYPCSWYYKICFSGREIMTEILSSFDMIKYHNSSSLLQNRNIVAMIDH